MKVSAPLEANAQAPAVIAPHMRQFNHQTEFPQAAALFRATLCDYRLDAAYATNRRDRVNQRQPLGNVAAIRTGQERADGNAVCVAKEVMFGTRPRAISGVRASFSPAPTARTNEESAATSQRPI